MHWRSQTNWKIEPADKTTRPAPDWVRLVCAMPNTHQKYYYCQKFRSSPQKVFFQKGVLKICIKFAGKHPCRKLISIKLTCSFIKYWNLTSPWVFSCKLRTYLQNTSWRNGSIIHKTWVDKSSSVTLLLWDVKMLLITNNPITFTCWNPAIETLERGVNMFKVNRKNTRTTLLTLFWCFYC